MKRLTNEEIEKYASEQTKDFDKYLRPASIELITMGAKFARTKSDEYAEEYAKAFAVFCLVDGRLRTIDDLMAEFKEIPK